MKTFKRPFFLVISVYNVKIQLQVFRQLYNKINDKRCIWNINGKSRLKFTLISKYIFWTNDRNNLYYVFDTHSMTEF